MDGWEGVTCCPDTMPIYVPGVGCRPVAEGERRRRSLLLASAGQAPEAHTEDDGHIRRLGKVTRPFVDPSESDDADGRGGATPSYQPVFDAPNGTWPSGCSSGWVTGTALDYARCVVVELDLRSNNATGMVDLDALVALLPNLQALRLDNNSLTGPVPTRLITGMVRMDTIGLAMNRFSYRETDAEVFTT